METFLPPLTARGIAVLGDSRTDQLSYGAFAANGAPTIDQASYNLFSWLQNASFGRFPIWGEFATGALTSTQILDKWLAVAIASRPFAVCFVGTGNDPAHSVSVDRSKANVDAIVNGIRSAGIKMILLTDPGFENFTPQQMDDFHGTGGLNDHIRAKHNTATGICVIDIVPTLLASTRPLRFKAEMSYDYPRIHWSAKAAVTLAKQIIEALAATDWFPATPKRDRTSNALLNPGFATLKNGSNGTGNTGSLPASWNGVGVSSSEWTQAFSVHERFDGDVEIVGKATKTGGSALRDIYVSQNVALTPGGSLGGQVVDPGDYVSAGALIDIDAGHSKLLGVLVMCNMSYMGGVPAFDQAYNSKMSRTPADIPIPPGAYAVEQYTRPYKMPLNWTKNVTIGVRFGVQMRDADTITYRIRRPWLRKIQPNDLASTY